MLAHEVNSNVPLILHGVPGTSTVLAELRYNLSEIHVFLPGLKDCLPISAGIIGSLFSFESFAMELLFFLVFSAFTSFISDWKATCLRFSSFSLCASFAIRYWTNVGQID